ncbi:protein phosphatase 1 regulatory subunit 36 [Polypterus senegalus]|uniref:protein phosphatase 1 regulatory subunit 36 n=1 Tax=Polypterus senegalus TaxID=55291 RepID=UPI00196430B0|nr:protein phosphatase 1 regulatory subunit 36 [Polypterus senegalus]
MANEVTSAPLDMIGPVVPGRWNWNEDTRSLEFFSFSSSVESKDKRKKSNKTINFQDFGSKHSDRLPSAPARGANDAKTTADKKKNQKAESGSPKPALKQGHHERVTLEDVKAVALGLLKENENQTIASWFMALIRSPQLNDFLSALLLYLSFYFEEKAVIKKWASLLLREPSLQDKRDLALLHAKVEAARKQFALTYSILVLGLGIEEQHHLACGKKRGSSTCKDRLLFECIYNYCAYVAWVTFRRKDLPGIQEEVYRLFRTDNFNAIRRVRIEEKSKAKVVSKGGRASPSNVRRSLPKRPSIKSIIHQRSPAMVSLLPSPKESALHLYKQRHLSQEGSTDVFDLDALSEEITAALSSKIGIIGEPLRHFNPQTLIPRDTEREEENEETETEEKGTDENVRKSKTTFASRAQLSGLNESNGNMSRPVTVISRATTEGVYSDTE